MFVNIFIEKFYHYKKKNPSVPPPGNHMDSFYIILSLFLYLYFIFAKRSTALVKFSMVLSASPCSIPSLTQCWI